MSFRTAQPPRFDEVSVPDKLRKLRRQYYRMNFIEKTCPVTTMRKSALAILVLAAMNIIAACGVCEEKSLSEISSPNGDYVAAVYRRNCGATSRLLYHLNIRKKSNGFSSDHRGVIEEGQVFLTDTGKVTMIWKDNNTLLVDCESCSADRRPVMESSWNGVNISYQLH